MVKKKAKKANKPRMVKTWRIRQDVVKELARQAKVNEKSESEILEDAFLSQYPL